MWMYPVGLGANLTLMADSLVISLVQGLAPPL